MPMMNSTSSGVEVMTRLTSMYSHIAVTTICLKLAAFLTAILDFEFSLSKDSKIHFVLVSFHMMLYIHRKAMKSCQSVILTTLFKGKSIRKITSTLCTFFCHLSRLVGKPTMWFRNRSDTNQAVQSQKRARSLKFWS